MALDKDLNVPPYFDDYDETKKFHRVLYRPALPIQARELNQQQTILQNQIERFGNHIFKDGSVVDGVGVIYHPNIHYMSLADNFNSNTSLYPADLDNTYLITNSTDSANAVRATIKIAKTGLITAQPATNRMYFDYVYTGTNATSGADINRFSEGDTLYVYDANQGKLSTLDANNLLDTIGTLTTNGSFTASGNAYCLTVTDGTIFQKGFFSKVSKQTITVRDYSTNVTGYIVGFDTTESVVSPSQDSTLYDNALGYSNENAPGAHRLKLEPTLVSKLKTDSANNIQFFALVEFDGQEPTEQNDDPAYAILEQQLSRKTYEESGDYVVKPFQIESRTAANTSNFYYEISPGIAYARGYRVEKLGSTKVEIEKASTTNYSQNQIITGNYGNYVVCDEFLGTFNVEEISSVTLYDTAQNAISEYEGTDSAPSGSSVGTANIRAVEFNSGTRKGIANTTYLIYLFNIVMNSGKSFSTDVKSIYTNDATLGKAKADLVLENSLAVLKENTKLSVVFPSGFAATKRLTDNTGISDTTYIYNQTKASTIATDGTITISSLDTAAPGAGLERIPLSAGAFTGSDINDFNFYTVSNTYTANLSGTINLQTGQTVLAGTGTSFGTEIAADDIIRIDDGSSQHLRRIVSVTNTTQIILDASIAATNTACVYQWYLPAGLPLPINTVTVSSNTAFVANLDYTMSAANDVYCTFNVLRNQATAINKLINKSRYVKIDCGTHGAGAAGPWDLGITDVHKIRNIFVGTSYANTNTDRKTWFELDNGQKDAYYDHGKLSIKPQFASSITASSKLFVELDYFSANLSSSVGFFSVESYPIDDANTSNTTAITSFELPVYKGVELRNVIDFRPLKFNTANSVANGDPSNTFISENPAVSNSAFNIPSDGQYMIAPDSNFVADFEYYLPRKDIITVDTSGNFIVNKGEPSLTPRVPFVENDQTLLAESFVPPYPTATRREYDLYPYNKLDFVKIQSRTNRRYTMKDIGILENRLKRVEYYTVLNILEQQAKDLTITDANGLDRFKNGIFADPFNSHKLGNVIDFEYKIAIDSKEGVARPFINKHDIDFQYNSSNSSNIQKTGPIITLPYDHELAISQRYATKVRNTTESVWQWNGLCSLYPSYDFHRDETIAPNVNANLDLASPWEDFANSPFGQMYGDWNTVATNVSQSVSSSTSAFGSVLGSFFGGTSGTTTSTTTTTTTSTTQQQMMDQLNVDVSTQTIDLGSYVRDVTIQPYLASKLVAFVSYNMKPNTTLHTFFDDVNVDAYCAPGVLSGVTNPEAGFEDKVVSKSGDFGDALTSDANGFVCGVFMIPSQTFRTGERVFQITNIDDLTTGVDAKLTLAKATFTGDNVETTRGSTTLTIRNPELSFNSTVAGSRTSTVSSSDTVVTSQINTTVFVTPAPVWDNDQGDGGGGDDPIAQSFTLASIPNASTGMFVTKIGAYFKTKDSNLGINLLLCEMNNGVPNMNRILGKSYVAASAVNTSTTAATETVFTFEYPIFLINNIDYAFVIQPDGNSPNYEIWVGETGGFDVATEESVFSNPYAGILFISANRKSWTSVQKEDLKFNVYRARFNQATGYAVFNNEDDEYLTVDGWNRVNTSIGLNVGDVVYSVNSSANVANTANLVSFVLSGGSDPFGRVQWVDEANGDIWLDSSNNGGFSNTANPTIAVFRPSDNANTSLLTVNTIIAYANVSIVNNLKYHAVVPKFGTLQPSKTNITYDFKGTSNANVFDTAYQSVDNNTEYEYRDKERHAMSKSNEVANLSSAKSSNFRLNLSSTSDFVSPVINLSKKVMLYVQNVINNDATNEHTRYGNAHTRYISKKLVLADGQEAEDLKVTMTAYRPADTDIKVYAKFINPEDPEAFNDKVWTELEYLNGSNSVYSSPQNVKDYIEYDLGVPSTNAVAMGAFANVDAATYDPLTGTIALVDGSLDVTGTSTLFQTELSVGDVIKVVDSSYFAIRTVTSIASNTALTLDKAVESTNAASLHYVYNVVGNDGRVEYKNSVGSRFVGFKEVALKMVLLSNNAIKVPRLNDVRSIALQV